MNRHIFIALIASLDILLWIRFVIFHSFCSFRRSLTCYLVRNTVEDATEQAGRPEINHQMCNEIAPLTLSKTNPMIIVVLFKKAKTFFAHAARILARAEEEIVWFFMVVRP